MLVSRRTVAIALFLVTTLISPLSIARNDIHSSQFLELGTLAAITIRGDKEQAAVAEQAVRDVLKKIDQDWHPWRQGARLAGINRDLMEVGQAALPEDMKPLLERSKLLAQQSGGTFDPAVGAMVKLWQFDDSANLPSAPPVAEQISALLNQHMSGQWMQVKSNRISARPGTQLDLGGFAKGYAVAESIVRLRLLGVTDAIVNLGGDLAVLGSKGDRPWRIGVRHPRGEGPLAVLELEDGEAVFTSGDYERFFDHGGKRYHHILDPRTGYPASGLTSVTVLHQDAALADAATTALFVAGPEQWQQVARAMKLEQVMVVDETGDVSMTAAMKARTRIVAKPRPNIKVVAD